VLHILYASSLYMLIFYHLGFIAYLNLLEIDLGFIFTPFLMRNMKFTNALAQVELATKSSNLSIRISKYFVYYVVYLVPKVPFLISILRLFFTS